MLSVGALNPCRSTSLSPCGCLPSTSTDLPGLRRECPRALYPCGGGRRYRIVSAVHVVAVGVVQVFDEAFHLGDQAQQRAWILGGSIEPGTHWTLGDDQGVARRNGVEVPDRERQAAGGNPLVRGDGGEDGHDGYDTSTAA